MLVDVLLPHLMRINAAADDTGTVFVDGEVVIRITTVRRLYTAVVNKTSKTIAADIHSTVKEIGLMVYISTGIVSDTSWKCVSDLDYSNWTSPGFDDSQWPAAISYYINNGNSRNDIQMDDFPKNAHWITTLQNEADRMMCRRSLT